MSGPPRRQRVLMARPRLHLRRPVQQSRVAAAPVLVGEREPDHRGEEEDAASTCIASRSRSPRVRSGAPSRSRSRPRRRPGRRLRAPRRRCPRRRAEARTCLPEPPPPQPRFRAPSATSASSPSTPRAITTACAGAAAAPIHRLHAGIVHVRRARAALRARPRISTRSTSPRSSPSAWSGSGRSQTTSIRSSRARTRRASRAATGAGGEVGEQARDVDRPNRAWRHQVEPELEARLRRDPQRHAARVRERIAVRDEGEGGTADAVDLERGVEAPAPLGDEPGRDAREGEVARPVPVLVAAERVHAPNELGVNCDPFTYAGPDATTRRPRRRRASSSGSTWWLPRGSACRRPAPARLPRDRAARRCAARTSRYKHDIDRIEIVCDRPLPLQADGEDLGDVERVEIEAEREALPQCSSDMHNPGVEPVNRRGGGPGAQAVVIALGVLGLLALVALGARNRGWGGGGFRRHVRASALLLGHRLLGARSLLPGRRRGRDLDLLGAPERTRGERLREATARDRGGCFSSSPR